MSKDKPRKKTTEYFKLKRNDVRTKKRELTSNAGGMDAEQVKNEKLAIKREYRGLKRSEKQQLQHDIDQDVEDEEAVKQMMLDQHEGEEAFALEELMNQDIDPDMCEDDDENADEGIEQF